MAESSMYAMTISNTDSPRVQRVPGSLVTGSLQILKVKPGLTDCNTGENDVIPQCSKIADDTRHRLYTLTEIVKRVH